MKFWKLSALATVMFCGIIITYLYSACEKNVCNNVNCLHGGSCSGGICKCPTGYEDPQCQTLSTARYVGIYVGYTQCDELSRTIDTAWVTTSTKGILNVDVRLKGIAPKILHGTINSTVSTYSIIVSNNDTAVTVDTITNYDAITKKDTSFYFNKYYHKTYTIMLQNDMTLSINSYEQTESIKDSLYHKCYFLSTKKL